MCSCSRSITQIGSHKDSSTITHTQVISIILANYCVGLYRLCLIDIFFTLLLALLHLLACENLHLYHLSESKEFGDNTESPEYFQRELKQPE